MTQNGEYNLNSRQTLAGPELRKRTTARAFWPLLFRANYL